jgi:hypothetical protein
MIVLFNYPVIMIDVSWFPTLRLVSIWIFISLWTVLRSMDYAIRKAINQDKTPCSCECIKDALKYFFRIADMDFSAPADKEDASNTDGENESLRENRRTVSDAGWDHAWGNYVASYAITIMSFLKKD